MKQLMTLVLLLFFTNTIFSQVGPTISLTSANKNESAFVVINVVNSNASDSIYVLVGCEMEICSYVEYLYLDENKNQIGCDLFSFIFCNEDFLRFSYSNIKLHACKSSLYHYGKTAANNPKAKQIRYVEVLLVLKYIEFSGGKCIRPPKVLKSSEIFSWRC